MGRLLISAVVAGVLLSGCSDNGEASTPTPSPSPSVSSASPTTSPSPTPPVMPEAAKEHTEAGAIAFVEYFWEVVDYASVNLDPAAVRELIADSCGTCQGGIRGIEKAKRSGGMYSGGGTTVRDAAASRLMAGDLRYTKVTFVADNERQVLDYPGTANDQVYEPASVRMTMFLTEKPDAGWEVSTWEIHS